MKKKAKILITSHYPVEVLGGLIEEADVIMPPAPGQFFTPQQIRAQAVEVQAIINQGEVPIDVDLLAASIVLKIVANASIGVNNLRQDLMKQRGIWGTNTPDAFSDATADVALAYILMLARRLGEADRYVRAGRWHAFMPGAWDGMLLRGSTLGLVGYGRIGRAVARRAEAFGMRVIHHTRTTSALADWRPLEQLLCEADFVSLHVPLNEESRGMITADRLALLKPSAFLINLSRGPVVDERALVVCLQERKIAGAALDVFADEPNVPHEFHSMENVVLTPHLGGGSKEGRRSAQELCVANVRRVLAGGEPDADCVIVRPH